MSASDLVKVTIERRPDGCWTVTRERSESGERFMAEDLYAAFDIVFAAYRPDGTPREMTP